MNTEGLHVVMDWFFEECPRVLEQKGREYACLDGDRLINFKQTADELGGVPEYSCANHLYKQMKSIFQIVQDLMSGQKMSEVEKNLAEPWRGRIVDAINYLILMAALIKEREEDEGAWHDSHDTQVTSEPGISDETLDAHAKKFDISQETTAEHLASIAHGGGSKDTD